MSSNIKGRRRRTGSTSVRYRPAQLVQAEPVGPKRVGKAEIAACAAVGLVACALTALIWILTIHAVQDQRIEIRERAEQALLGQAADIAETVGHELLMIDQSLVILQAAWKADSNSFDLSTWQREMPALTATADDLFVSDEKHIVRQDILPQAVGQGVGAAYVNFPHGSLEEFQSDGSKNKDSLLLQNDVGAPIDARQFLMYIIRPLDHPTGWLIGASFRSSELTKLFAQSALGNNPVVALVDTRRGIVQAVVGPAARRPKTDLAQSPLFNEITRSEAGTWIGDTAIDGVERLHGFHRVGARDMVVVVAASLPEVMAPADALASSAHAVAFVATGLVMAIAGLVLWELFAIRGNRRQKRTYARTRSELERLRAEETLNIARTQLNAARLQAVLDGTGDGIALFDSGLRLVQWNHPFLRGIGIEPRKDMPLDSLLREQAANGLFGPVADVETEVGRRAGILLTGDAVGLPQPGPVDETLILRGLPITEGGFMLLLNGLTTWEPPPARESDEPASSETVVSGPIEW